MKPWYCSKFISQHWQALTGTRDLLVFAEEKELFFNMGLHLHIVFVDVP